MNAINKNQSTNFAAVITVGNILKPVFSQALNIQSSILQRFPKAGAAWLLFLLLTMACNNDVPKKVQHASGNTYQQKRLQRYTDSIYPLAKTQVESGDIILRLGSDITSEMFRQMNKTDQRFSHAGIASIEQDSIFVYHAIGGEFNPDQKIKREPIYSFGHPADNKSLAIIRTKKPMKQRREIAARARSLYLQGIPFDMKFDYSTEDRLYCSEFVAKCIVRAVQDSSWLHFTHTGPLKFVAVDNLLLASIMQQQMSWQY
ncbi:MAG TPA: YiiX/YebB-like N1pC/P60 family cysteine hydrolase [Phnomibacter sp.]|nr:YiiX/YebB-like N1pC/P60 family cysteine hydrolase [Phnomibacter sp.]